MIKSLKTFESKPENLGLVLGLFILEGPQKEGNASSKDVVAGLSIPSFHSSDNWITIELANKPISLHA